jgi:tetratricopeptide (TPR) repeat protein
VAAFDQALRLDPDNAASHFEKGSVLPNDLKRDEEALVALDQAARLSPNNGLLSGYAYLLKGLALLALKRYEEAVAAFDQVLRIADSMAKRAKVNGAYAAHMIGLADDASKGKDEALLALKNNEEGHGSF